MTPILIFAYILGAVVAIDRISKTNKGLTIPLVVGALIIGGALFGNGA